MALSSSPDCLFRPEDKALRILFPSIEDASASAFDDYLNGDIYDLGEQEDNKNLSEALTEYLDRKPSLHSNGRLSPVVGPARNEKLSPQPWRKGLWCMNQNVPEITIAKTRNNNFQHNPSLKIPQGNSEVDAFLDSRSPPATPSSIGTKRVPLNPRTAKFSQSPYARRGISREVTLSPTPMYAQMQHKQRMAQHDTWQEDFQNFHLRPAYDDLPLSPPLSGRIPQQQIHVNQLNAAMMAQNGAVVQHQDHLIAYPGVQLMHAMGQNYSDVDPAVLNQADFVNAGTSQGQDFLSSTPHQPQIYPGLPTWTTESLHSSDESQNSYEGHQDPSNSMQNQQWYSPALSPGDTMQHQHSRQYYYPIVAAPTPYRPTHQLVRPHHLQTQGLGIQYTSSALSTPTNTHETQAMGSYPPLPPPSTYAFTNDDPFSTPQQSRRQRPRQQSSPFRSPSPSVSPTNTTTARTLRQRSPTHHTSPTHSRRKSIHKLGPISTPNLSTMPRTPRTPKTPRTPTGGFVDFVNFTPRDSAKLLSDVAPSGSSKTRARREQEARQKRKRLSEAAIKAVRRAGGDVRALKAEGVCLT